jgi:Mor family transcriptional regulator
MCVLVEHLGSKSAWRLVERLGGTSLYVPWQPTVNLLSHVDLADAQRLCAAMGGEGYIEIPLRASLSVAYRNAQICAEAEAGATHRALARQYRITERHVRRILARCHDYTQKRIEP